MTNRDQETERTASQTDGANGAGKLRGLDRSRLGEKGWAEVSEDKIGGHPELETAPDPASGGGLNGPQAETDLATGGVKPVTAEQDAPAIGGANT